MNNQILKSVVRIHSGVFAIAISAVSATIGFSGESSAAQPIDMKSRIASVEVQSDDCRTSNPTDIGLRICALEELEAWDVELNIAYRTLINGLGSDAARAELRSVQRAWLTYRDAEFEYIENKYSHISGSMYPRLIALQKIPIVKNRVLQLSMHVRTREL